MILIESTLFSFAQITLFLKYHIKLLAAFSLTNATKTDAVSIDLSKTMRVV